MSRFTNAKKTQVRQIVIAGKAIDMRIKWDSENQEYECNVKLANDSRYSSNQAYFTSNWIDAFTTVERMASDLVTLSSIK